MATAVEVLCVCWLILAMTLQGGLSSPPTCRHREAELPTFTKRGQLCSHQVVGLPASLSHPGRGMGPGLEGHSGLSNLSAYDGRFYNRCPRSPPCPSPYNTRKLPCLCPRKTTHWLSSFLVFDLALMDGRGAAAVGALAPC